MAPCHTLLSFILIVTATLAVASPKKKSTFTVQVHHEAKLSIFPTHKHWYESSLVSIINHATTAETTTTAASAAVLHTYDTVFHGFSAKLSPLEAQKLESLSHVVAVIRSRSANSTLPARRSSWASKLPTGPASSRRRISVPISSLESLTPVLTEREFQRPRPRRCSSQLEGQRRWWFYDAERAALFAIRDQNLQDNIVKGKEPSQFDSKAANTASTVLANIKKLVDSLTLGYDISDDLILKQFVKAS
ncbi:hypothetical protein AHAS_Ahas02G0010300 [Arachis hypogaea]